jgi:5-hydroxyisourate hydrolase-like protein (transthyretin family)
MEHAVTPKRTVRAALGALASAAVLAALLIGAGSAEAAEEAAISGKVTAAKDGSPIAEVAVVAFRSDESSPKMAFAETDANGEYTIDKFVDESPLEPGNYSVAFSPEGSNYLFQGYPETVVVAAEPVTGVDAELLEGGIFEGVVSDAATGTPIAGAEVCIYYYFCVTTASNGAYAFEGLEPDEQVIVRFSAMGYVTQYWHGKQRDSEADPIAVEAEKTVSGIDAALSKSGSSTETPPAESQPPALFPTVSTTPRTTTPPKRKRCRRGFRRKRVHGHYRCVKRHRHRKHRRHRPHR